MNKKELIDEMKRQGVPVFSYDHNPKPMQFSCEDENGNPEWDGILFSWLLKAFNTPNERERLHMAYDAADSACSYKRIQNERKEKLSKVKDENVKSLLGKLLKIL